MIAITDGEGRTHYINPDAIAWVAPANPNLQGIEAYIRTFEGATLSAQQQPADIAEAIDRQAENRRLRVEVLPQAKVPPPPKSPPFPKPRLTGDA